MQKKKRKLFTEFFTDIIYEQIWKKRGQRWDRRLMGKLRMLHPVSDKELNFMVKEYRQGQIRLFLSGLLVLGIFLLIAIVWVLLPARPIIIERNSYGEGEKEEVVYAGEQGEIAFAIQEQEYTKEDLEQAFQEGFSWARKKMLKDNSSASEVRSDLNFVTEVPGGLKAEWISDNPDYIQEDGTLGNAEWEQERKELVLVTLLLSYGSELRKQELHFTVRGPELSSAQKLRRNIKAMLQKIESETRTENSFTLPVIVEGIELKRSQTGKQIFSMLILIFALFLFLFYQRQGSLKEKLEKRKKEVQEDYPRIVNQLVLYLGAGMNLKTAFEKIAVEYQNNRQEGRISFRYAYQELYVMSNAMKAGLSEKRAYESYGSRIGEGSYIKLMALIVQNLQKGNADLLKTLAQEEKTAFLERISQAKKRGEEAGTRLLFPMVLLLVVVMVIVMLPAVFQFQNY